MEINLKELASKVVESASASNPVQNQAASLPSPDFSAAEISASPSFNDFEAESVMNDALSLFDDEDETKENEELIKKQQEAQKKKEEAQAKKEAEAKEKEELEAAQEELEKAQKMTEEEIQQGYDEFVAKLQSAGLKTTGLRNGEVNFAEYAAALSDEVKQEILDSFDCEADYILQQEIAGIFTGDNDIKNADFASALRKAGYEVERESVRTSYIIDDKKDAAHHGGEYTTGAITMFTIRDPETGAEIKIVDSNGNGAIEVEELFMNELLSGIATQIDTSNFQKFSEIHSGSYSEFSAGYNPITGSIEGDTDEKTEAGEDEAKSGKAKLSSAEYQKLKNQITQDIMSQEGLSFEKASVKANAYMKVTYEIVAAGNSEGITSYAATKGVNEIKKTISKEKTDEIAKDFEGKKTVNEEQYEEIKESARIELSDENEIEDEDSVDEYMEKHYELINA